LDLAIVDGRLTREGLTAVVLWREDYVLVVPPGHPLVGTQRPVALADVLAEPFILAPASGSKAVVEAAGARRGRKPVVVGQPDNLEGFKRMVAAGVGITLLPRIITLDPDRWPGSVITLTPNDAGRTVVLLHRGASYLTPSARALRDAIVQH